MMRRRMAVCSAAGAGIVMALGMSMASYAATGWQKEGDDWRYYERDGAEATNAWKKSGGQWFYLGDDGLMVKSQLVEDGDDYYYVTSNGARAVNQWRKLPNEDPDDEEEPAEVWYYFQSNGKAYRAPESGKTSFKTIVTASGAAKKYTFNEKGHMLTGWVNGESQRVTGDEAWKEGIYYCGGEDDGAMVQGEWRRLEAIDDENEDSSFDDTYWFYFQTNGKKTADTKKTINGRKYLFLENGNAQYQWYGNLPETGGGTVSVATKNSYYKRPDQCWLATGWFYTVPGREIDAQAYEDDEPYWFYGLGNGGVVTSQIKTINGQSYGFNEKGEMLHGLYKLTIDGKKILTWEEIESADDFPSADSEEAVYYFGDKPKEGVMATGKQTISLDGEKYTCYFKKSGTGKGAGTEGIYDGAIYEKGRLLTIDDGLRYGIVEYEGKEYLVNQSGKIQKNKKNVKDSDDTYYSSDKNGIVTHTGEKE